MTLHDLNSLSPNEATHVMLKCCASREWATRMTLLRPFAAAGDLFDTADRTWLSLSEVDWLEAFAAHPRIGERTESRTAQREQSAIGDASAATMQELAEANAEYEARFGFIFIVFATGKSAAEMLDLLRKRIGSPRNVEIRVAAAEQMKITRLRLQRLFSG